MVAFLSRSRQDDMLSSEEEKVIITNVYHTVNHSVSYNSMSCSSQLNNLLYNDSKIAIKIHLGRTKASYTAFNVLAPLSIQLDLKTFQENTYFSISTGASNHRSLKLFPILMRFFTTGIKLCLLDFFDDPDEQQMQYF